MSPRLHAYSNYLITPAQTFTEALSNIQPDI